MPLTARCRCGKSLSVNEELAGKKVRCPACKEVLTVPPLMPVLEEEDDYDEEAISAKPPRRRPAEDSEDYDRPRRKRPAEDSEDYDRPRRKSKKKKGPKRKWDAPLFDKPRTSGYYGGIDTSVAGGVAMIVISLTWLIVGLNFGWIFFYPIILFVAGVIAVIKGLFFD